MDTSYPGPIGPGRKIQLRPSRMFFFAQLAALRSAMRKAWKESEKGPWFGIVKLHLLNTSTYKSGTKYAVWVRRFGSENKELVVFYDTRESAIKVARFMHRNIALFAPDLSSCDLKRELDEAVRDKRLTL